MMMLTHQRNLYDEISFISAGLSPGTSARVVCPKCGGGYSKEKSCAVSLSVGTERTYFRCFRAKCNWGGTVTNGPQTGLPSKDIPFSKRQRQFDRPIEPLDEHQIKWYREKFGVSPDKNTFYCPSKDMYAYQIKGPEGQLRGWQLRSYVPGCSVKALNYVERDEPFISWYYPRVPEIGGVVVVEDIPSARKCQSCGISAVALLGTSIDFERAYEIAGKCENFVILALDRGMLAKQIDYRGMFEPLWGSVEIWQLQEDLKYVSRERIREAIFDGKSDFISVHSE